jgi:hypothetical protein
MHLVPRYCETLTNRVNTHFRHSHGEHDQTEKEIQSCSVASDRTVLSGASVPFPSAEACAPVVQSLSKMNNQGDGNTTSDTNAPCMIQAPRPPTDPGPEAIHTLRRSGVTSTSPLTEYTPLSGLPFYARCFLHRLRVTRSSLNGPRSCFAKQLVVCPSV